MIPRIRWSVVGALFLAVILATGFVGCVRIPAGYVGIQVSLAGSRRGVSDDAIRTGWVLYSRFTEQVFEYPTFVQTAVWTRNPNEGSPENEEVTFSTKDQVPLSADISLSYRLDGNHVPRFYEQFRSDDLRVFTHGFLRNAARGAFGDTAGDFTVEEVMSTKRREFMDKVKEAINKSVLKYGVILEQFDFIGAPRPPANIVTAINAKVEATQHAIQVENELRAVEAEAKKKVAEADGIAKANDAITRSLTPQVMEWKRMELQQQAIGKWNGVLPSVNAGGNMPFLLQLPAK